MLCSAILYTGYKCCLLREKMFVFNGAYLVAVLLLSVLVPFITIDVKDTENILVKIEQFTTSRRFSPGQMGFS